MGRTNLRWEPTAAGKGGAECVAAARLMRAIQELISLAVLKAERPWVPQGHRVGPAASPRPQLLCSHSSPASQDPSLKKPEALLLADWLSSAAGFSHSSKREIPEGNRFHIKCQNKKEIMLMTPWNPLSRTGRPIWTYKGDAHWQSGHGEGRGAGSSAAVCSLGPFQLCG